MDEEKYFIKFKNLDTLSGKIFLVINVFLIFYYIISLIWYVCYKLENVLKIFY